MPKHKKADTSSDSDSGPEDVRIFSVPVSFYSVVFYPIVFHPQRNPPAKKHAPGKSKSSEPPDEQGWHIGNNRFANVREFKGKIMVDIREYYEKDGELKPGKKGTSIRYLLRCICRPS